MAASDQSAPLFPDFPPPGQSRRFGHILRFHELVGKGWVPVLTAVELQTWLALEHHANDKQDGLVPDKVTTKVLADAIGHATTANVRKARRALAQLRLIEVVSEGGGGDSAVVKMLTPGKPGDTELGRERLGRPGSNRTGSIPDPVPTEPTPGSVGTDPRFCGNRPPGSVGTAHYIRRVNDVFDGNDGAPAEAVVGVAGQAGGSPTVIQPVPSAVSCQPAASRLVPVLPTPGPSLPPTPATAAPIPASDQPAAPVDGTPVTRKGVPIPEVLSTPAFLPKWREWEQHLVKKRVGTTDVADRLQLAECAEWGVPRSVSAINHSIKKNYQGIYEPRGGQSNGHRQIDRNQAARPQVTTEFKIKGLSA